MHKMATLSTSFKKHKSLLANKLAKFSTSLEVIRKYKKNKLRYLRRKRSKLRYRQHRKQLRLHREFKGLSTSVSFFDISDMDMEVQNDIPFLQPIQEISAWQQQHQVAYWKSRAVALQYENKMLKEHLRRVYTQEIEDYVGYTEEQQEEEYQNVGDDLYYNSYTETRNRKTKKATDEDLDYGHEIYVKEMEKKRKKEEAIALYGNMAPTINGMQTAVQLQYDSYVNKNKPPLWPNIPLKL